VEDIIRVADCTAESNNKIVLGARQFSGRVPFRSAVGNSVTRAVFSFASGEAISDTQTGLRGFPMTMLPWLIKIEGKRFEYEMNMLLQAKPSSYGITEIKIATVYHSGNSSSHFRAIQDSLRVCFPFLKFCASGITSAFVDYALLFLLQWMTKDLFISVVGARAASSLVNFSINRLFVFDSSQTKHKKATELIYYYLLVGILLMFNYLLLRFLSQDLKIDLVLSKVLTEITLFGFSFAAQHLFIFKEGSSSKNQALFKVKNESDKKANDSSDYFYW
jgi:putative flippase GtrA